MCSAFLAESSMVGFSQSAQHECELQEKFYSNTTAKRLPLQTDDLWGYQNTSTLVQENFASFSESQLMRFVEYPAEVFAVLWLPSPNPIMLADQTFLHEYVMKMVLFRTSLTRWLYNYFGKEGYQCLHSTSTIKVFLSFLIGTSTSLYNNVGDHVGPYSDAKSMLC